MWRKRLKATLGKTMPYGLPKRLDEVREIMDLLEGDGIDFLRSHRWVTFSWLRELDDYLVRLAEEAGISLHEVRSRPDYSEVAKIVSEPDGVPSSLSHHLVFGSLSGFFAADDGCVANCPCCDQQSTFRMANGEQFGVCTACGERRTWLEHAVTIVGVDNAKAWLAGLSPTH